MTKWRPVTVQCAERWRSVDELREIAVEVSQ